MPSPAAESSSAWTRLIVSNSDHVALRHTLCGGQCFRWTMTRFGTYVGVIQNRAYELRPVDVDIRGNSAIEYRRLATKRQPTKRKVPTPSSPPTPAPPRVRDDTILSAYLALDVDLGAHWCRWVTGNPHRQHPLVQFFLTDVDAKASSLASPAVPPSGTRRKRKPSTPADPSQQGSPNGPGIMIEYSPPVAMMRMLRQDVHQTLFEFLCSQNNHISRITSLVQKLCTVCGDHICDYDLQKGEVVPRTTPQTRAAEDPNILSLYTFPDVDQLATLSEQALRDLGFGYRAKYIVGATAAIKAARDDTRFQSSAELPVKTGWSQHAESCREPFYQRLLTILHEKEDRDATGSPTKSKQALLRKQLLTLPGIGRKVADCVLLFALDQHDIVPVDTHMVQVAIRYLTPVRAAGRKRARTSAADPPGDAQWEAVLLAWQAKQVAAEARRAEVGTERKRPSAATTKGKVAKATVPALQDAQHDAIQEGFRTLFGPYCGWAHSNIFFFVSSAS